MPFTSLCGTPEQQPSVGSNGQNLVPSCNVELFLDPLLCEIGISGSRDASARWQPAL